VSYNSVVRHYLSDLKREYESATRGGQHTAELSYRPVLDTLFHGLAAELNNTGNVDIVLEPRNQGRVGRPDWRIHDSITLGIYGYIEAKGLTVEPFDTTPYQNQFDRYLTLGHKLVITDGIDFVFCMESGTPPTLISLIDKTQLGRPDWSRLTIHPQFELFMRRFYADPSPQLCDESTLVGLVALRTKLLADDILRYAVIPLDEAFDVEREAIALLQNLRDLVYNHNDVALRTDKVFADFTAQVIMFCLLYAHRVLCSSTDTPVEKESKIKAFIAEDIEDVQELTPFKNLMHYLNINASDDCFIVHWVDECTKFLSFVQMTEHQLLNPDYHKLFELFLSKYDAQARFDYGAFYTPRELAEFVVELTEHVVHDSFDGVSIFNDGNTIIDPCCGTGSFLEQIVLHDTTDGAYNLCGFEIMPAPYMLANYRMAVLKKRFGEKHHLTDIVLANTLSNCVFGEPANADTIEGKELTRANALSSRPLKLIIGNPPSSDSLRSNTGTDFTVITDLMDDFRPPEERRRGRQNTQKQINNPHLQFLRWACDRLLQSKQHSVLSFVVPLSFLEAESYRYARKYLVEHFSSAWVVAVDADARTGVRSNSLFHTLQGRAVVIFSRKYDEANAINQYHFMSLTELSMPDKLTKLQTSAGDLIAQFTTVPMSLDTFAFLPAKPFDEALYDKFWPVSGEGQQTAIFQNHCSGIKLAPTALFTHVRAPFLKRRSRDIAQRGVAATTEWLGRQDKPPKDDKVNAFSTALNACGTSTQIDRLLTENITTYSFRPFLLSNVLLWQDVLKKYSRIGGGGTRLRPEIVQAYYNEHTVGFAMAHAPKDLSPALNQFVSFCWYFPDNDMCSRGNSHIYLNQYSSGTDGAMLCNIDQNLLRKVAALLDTDASETARQIVFYSYAILCSQKYLDEFEGALFIVHRADQRARVPMVRNAAKFSDICLLGKQVASLEKQDFVPDNVLGLDYDGILAMLTPGFHLENSPHPFEAENEMLILKSGNNTISIPCPLALQRMSISGYDVIKNCWLKFNSYNFTHCDFSRQDLKDLLDLLNKLTMHIELVGQIDEAIQPILDMQYELILPQEESIQQ
jgi:type I restriction-modification system DNA methylase subunit